MPAKNLSHLAQLIADDGHATTFQSLGQYRQALLKEITQASAAPEQEPVAPIKIEVRDGCVYLRSGPLDPGEYKLYPHADPSEAERLRAENERLALESDGHNQRRIRNREETKRLRAELADALAARDKWGSNFQKAISAGAATEQKLAEALALLRICSAPVRAQISRMEEESKRSNHPHLYREEAGKLTQALRDLDAFLSATAQPAEVKS